jgi:hypothetical protein
MLPKPTTISQTNRTADEAFGNVTNRSDLAVAPWREETLFVLIPISMHVCMDGV